MMMKPASQSGRVAGTIRLAWQATLPRGSRRSSLRSPSPSRAQRLHLLEHGRAGGRQHAARDDVPDLAAGVAADHRDRAPGSHRREHTGLTSDRSRYIVMLCRTVERRTTDDIVRNRASRGQAAWPPRVPDDARTPTPRAPRIRATGLRAPVLRRRPQGRPRGHPRDHPRPPGRGADARLPDHPGGVGADRRRMAPQPRLRLPDAPAARGRGARSDADEQRPAGVRAHRRPGASRRRRFRAPPPGRPQARATTSSPRCATWHSSSSARRARWRLPAQRSSSTRPRRSSGPRAGACISCWRRTATARPTPPKPRADAVVGPRPPRRRPR